MYALVVIVLPSEHIDVQSHARSDREGVEDMRKHLRREVPDLLALELQVRNAVWTSGYVNNRS